MHSNCGVAHGDITSLSIVLNSVYNVKGSLPLLSEWSDTYGYWNTEKLNTWKKLTEESDVYSFGVVLAELLTGDMVINFREADYFFLQSEKIAYLKFFHLVWSARLILSS